MGKSIKKIKNYYINFPKNIILDICVYLTISYYIIKYKIFTITLFHNINTLPSLGWPRREHLVGHRLLGEPLFMGGAFSGSIDNFNLGPIPFNYPVGLGWLLSGLIKNTNVTPFYITTNIFYFITLALLVYIIYIIGKVYGKIGSYIIIFIIISSITILYSSSYFTEIPTYMNPGSVQFYSILVIFIFLAYLKSSNKKYLYSLVFFSGILLQNYIATIPFCIIMLLYGLYCIKKENNKSKLYYIYLILSLSPWIQILFRILTDLEGISKSIKFILFRNSWEDMSNYSIPLSNLINQTPFKNLLSNLYNVKDTPTSLSIAFFLFYLSLPLLNYLLLKKDLKKEKNKLTLLKIVTLLFTIDIMLNIYASNETQQFNHLAAYSYLFTFLIIYSILMKLKGIKNQILISLLIAISVFYNTSNALTHKQDQRIITDSVKNKLLETPLKIVKYDYYNNMDTVYTDFIYELLTYNIDLCLVKPEESNTSNNSSSIFKTSSLRNLKFVEHLFCNPSQLNDNNRKPIYLIEDPSMSLPLKLKEATLITRVSNKKNQRCAPEYYRKLEISNNMKGECLLYYKVGETNNNISVYIGGLRDTEEISMEQNNIIESSIINGKTMWGEG